MRFASPIGEETHMRADLRWTCLLFGTLGMIACSSTPARSPISLQAADYAIAMVGRPYRYGGSTPTGFDCSGLVYYSFARSGLQVPRDTRSLRRFGEDLDFNELTRGDLVFFDQEGKKSSHVGIYLGEGNFVHAPSTGGRVRIDSLYDSYWRRHLNEARRVM